MIEVINNFVDRDDLENIQHYLYSIKFNTKDEHVPLHDNLFSKNNIMFDVHTRGEMPTPILDIFSKLHKKIYEYLVALENKEYHPPMFSKTSIYRYRSGSSLGPHLENDRPEDSYRSFIVWTDNQTGGNFIFPEIGIEIEAKAGDLVIFKIQKENLYGISAIESGTLYTSESWTSPYGTAPFPNVDYDTTPWDTYEIKGF
jgi:hypothetical protein